MKSKHLFFSEFFAKKSNGRDKDAFKDTLLLKIYKINETFQQNKKIMVFKQVLSDNIIQRTHQDYPFI